MWEIFSRGAVLQLNDPKAFFLSGRRPSMPTECGSIPIIYKIMMKGWQKDPDCRFLSQRVFAKLLDARKLLRKGPYINVVTKGSGDILY